MTSSSTEWNGHVIKETYRIDSFLGEGGPSIVYRGTDLLLDVPVAIKRLKRTPTMRDGSSLAERFLREGRTQARLVHQNIVGIRAVLEEAGEYYIIMEYIDGVDLAQALELWPQHWIPLSIVERVFLQALEGLNHAHQHDVIHRDIKPSNILVRAEGQAKIADFGIARTVSDTRITQAGYLVGTVAYMSPEQLKGSAVDHRVDIYSLGVTLFEALTGVHPFRKVEDEISNFEMMSHHLYVQPPSLRAIRPEIPESLERVVLRSLAKEPEARYPNCTAFSDALREALQEYAQTPDPDMASHWSVLSRAAWTGPSAKESPASSESAAARGTDAYPPKKDVQALSPSSVRSGSAETGVFNREESEEERPSGVLVSVSPNDLVHSSGLSRSTRPPVQQYQEESKHELHAVSSVHASESTTGSFFREEPPSTPAPSSSIGTGVFDREHRLHTEQPQSASSPPVPSSGTGVFDRESHYSESVQSTSATSDFPRASEPELHAVQEKGAGTQAFQRSASTSLQDAQKVEHATIRMEPFVAETIRAQSPVPETVSAPVENIHTNEASSSTSNWTQETGQSQAAPSSSYTSKKAPTSKHWFRNFAGMLIVLCAGLLVGTGIVWKWATMSNPKRVTQQKSPSAVHNPDSLGPPSRRMPQVDTTNPIQPPKRITTPSVVRPAPIKRIDPVRPTCPSQYGEMVWVQGGTFTQGQRNARRRTNRPARQVTLTAFCMDRFEVTGEMYQNCVRKGQCSPTKRRTAPHLPVRYVTWKQANNYCRAVGKRLPREAEWEYAVRRQMHSAYPWGTEPQPRCTDVVWRSCKTRAPLQQEPTQRAIGGIHDLIGNVWEWMHDCYARDAYTKTKSHNPVFDRMRCKERVIRGGSFRSRTRLLAPYIRTQMRQRQARLDLGFRCVARPSSAAH